MSTKTKLASLFSMLNLFYPERDGKTWTGRFLVNQKKAEERAAELKELHIECPPDRDDLLHLIGMASIELKEFMDEHERIKDAEISHTQGILEINAALDNQMQPTDITEGMAVIDKINLLLGRYRQMYDLIHHIAHNVPADRTKTLAANFLEFKSDKLALVNQNEKVSQVDAGSGELVCTCGQSEIYRHSCPVHGNGVRTSDPFVAEAPHISGTFQPGQPQGTDTVGAAKDPAPAGEAH